MHVRFKVLGNMFICFFHVIVILPYLRACDIALHYDAFRYLDQFSINILSSIVMCFRSLVFCFSFLLFYSSLFMYFFASPDQRNICKFTLCCDFQLVHQSLRKYCNSFPFSRTIVSLLSLLVFKYRLQMRSDYLLITLTLSEH